MCTGAGNTPSAIELTETNIYDEILKATEALDDAEAPDTGRVLIVTPTTYKLLKQCPDITLDSDVAQEQRLQGVIAMVDGLSVVKVPAKRLPAQFGFMVCHKVATVAPAKLEDYKVHSDPPGISGDLVEGRIVYDAFVLENKKNAIYYQAVTAAE